MDPHRAGTQVDAAQPAQADQPISAEELRERVRLLLADCRETSPSEPGASDAISHLLAEMTAVTEGVLKVMPADARTLTDELAQAHAALVRLIEAVEQADIKARVKQRQEDRAGAEDRLGQIAEPARRRDS